MRTILPTSWLSLRPSEARLNALALLFFVGLAFLTLYPILFSTGMKTAGYDFFNYNWNFWWIRHALTTPALNIYENNFAMFPFTTNYGYHALTAVWFPLWALLEPLIGTLAVMNVIITLVCVLNGWLFFVLLRREKVAPGLSPDRGGGTANLTNFALFLLQHPYQPDGLVLAASRAFAVAPDRSCH